MKGKATRLKRGDGPRSTGGDGIACGMHRAGGVPGFVWEEQGAVRLKGRFGQNLEEIRPFSN